MNAEKVKKALHELIDSIENVNVLAKIYTFAKYLPKK
jgi:hypothetical protein